MSFMAPAGCGYICYLHSEIERTINYSNRILSMKRTSLPVKSLRRLLFAAVTSFISFQSFAQNPGDWHLDKMPVQLETDFALSSLPPQLRPGATVYLLDPNKGYYAARKGTNGFVCFVGRTDWEWDEFRNDVLYAISFDPAGAKTTFKVYRDVAAMRASGKFTPSQIKGIVIDRVKRGIYKAPGRTGISYMLEPVMRTYTGAANNNNVMTMQMPHYMFYAPYITNADIGNIPNGRADGPVVNNPEAPIFGEKNSPYAYIILLAGQKEAAKIIDQGKDLVKRLGDYRAFMKVGGH